MPIIGDIVTTSSDVSEYVSAWVEQYSRSHAIPKLSEEQERSAIHELCSHLYENLTILDTKSGALVGSNALATAVLAVLAFSPSSSLTAASHVQQIALFLLAPSLTSLLLNVTVISVYWSTTKELTGQTGISDCARSLVRLRSGRALRYRIAYVLHFAVLLTVLLMILGMSLKQLPF